MQKPFLSTASESSLLPSWSNRGIHRASFSVKLCIQIEEQTLKREIVDRLEQTFEEAIAEALERFQPRDLPLVPGRKTMHLMAKAAVTVYEAAVENSA